MNSETTTSKPCFLCLQPCTFRCGQCKCLYFCSQECQKHSWLDHKAFCKAVSRPSSSDSSTTSNQETTRTKKCLILDGMGPVGPNEEFMKLCKQELIRWAGLSVMVVNVNKGGRIPEQVACLLQTTLSAAADDPVLPFLHAMVMLWWGSEGSPLESEFGDSPEFQEAVVAWVNIRGGNLVVHGEKMHGEWPTWFGRNWEMNSYFRTDHKCFAVPSSSSEGDDNSNSGSENVTSIPHWCKWYHKVDGAIKGNYNVKSILLKNVDPEDVLFGTTDDARTYSPVPHMRGQPLGAGLTSVAFAKCQNGTVSFFGDVNWEEPTIRTMAVLARGDPSKFEGTS